MVTPAAFHVLSSHIWPWLPCWTAYRGPFPLCRKFYWTEWPQTPAVAFKIIPV